MKIINSILALLIIGIGIYFYYLTHNEKYFGNIATSEIYEGKRSNTERLNSLIQSGKMPVTSKLLLLAVKFGNLELTKYLIENGADYNEFSGNWPIYCYSLYSREIDNTQMVDYLINKGADFSFISKTRKMNLIHFIIEDYKLKDDDKFDLLSLNVDVFRKYLSRLIELGVDINLECNISGDTPLLFYLYNGGDKEIVRLFIERGANLNHINKDGMSALGIAIKKLKSRIIKLLKQHNAKAYFDGKIVTEENIKEKIDEKKRIERKKAAPEIIRYWKNYIKAWNPSLECEFHLMGGKEMRTVNTSENSSFQHLFKQVDAYVFGGCSKAKYFHYRIFDGNNKLYKEAKNLSWAGNRNPLMNENGKTGSLRTSSELLR